MKTIDVLNFSGRRAVVRVDFNVPLSKEFVVTDDTRIKAAAGTIKKIIGDGGSVVLLSHLGRPKGGPEDKFSLKHIVSCVAGVVGREIKFAGDCVSAEAFGMSGGLKPGEILLLENLRFYKEEESGDEAFAKKLAAHGEVYVNDAFGTAHRSHASTAVMAKFFDAAHRCFGYVMAGEVSSINKVMNHSEKPFTAIIGGAKVSDKILMIERLMDKVQHIIIGGGMAFTFVKAMGGRIGKSLCEDDKLEVAKRLLKLAGERGVQLHLPVDAVIADGFSNEAAHRDCAIDVIPDGWMGLDIGPGTIKKYEEVISNSKTILWNGPMGVFEMPNFEQGTRAVAECISKATGGGAYSLIGGGDSVAAINKYKLAERVSYVSTGGGALLEYIEQGSLPGVRAVEG